MHVNRLHELKSIHCIVSSAYVAFVAWQNSAISSTSYDIHFGAACFRFGQWARITGVQAKKLSRDLYEMIAAVRLHCVCSPPMMTSAVTQAAMMMFLDESID